MSWFADELERIANRHNTRGLFSSEILEDDFNDESDADSVCYDNEEPFGAKRI